ncbi:PREDICTED: mitochondrial carrier homolog 1-like [Acropora digitifera]|uniref:mitochondrial carrier homolog 1-like n=1 Tax=Acropora digitifera TaxID=70779 RepID=UPI000779F1B2|nr:PREDICTED: mitochondrial carrier homolog 1-like [Acropora digitifera]
MAAPHDNKGIEEILDNEGTTTGAIILGALMTTATHPLTCVRVLMQVGHEPIAPTPSRTLFGTKVLRLPSFFQYGKISQPQISKDDDNSDHLFSHPQIGCISKRFS